MGIKLRIAAAVALCLFVLSGCGISGEVYEKTPHVSEPQGQIPSDLYVVTSYASIKNKLRDMVENAVPSAKLAVMDYWGDIDTDLMEIIKDITTNDAVGSYAVASIAYEQAKASGYHQVSISVQYKKTVEEINSIISVSDDRDLEKKLFEMFSDFKTYSSFKVATKKSDEELIKLAYKGYYSRPETAIGLKSIKISPARDTFSPQVIDVSAEYLWSREELEKKKNQMLSAVQSICEEARNKTTDEKINFIAQYVSKIKLDQEAMIVVAETDDTQHKTEVYSAYGAITNQKSAQSGIALLTKLMCDNLNIKSHMIVGEKKDIPHLWLMVNRGEIWQHFDVTNGVDNYIISSIDLAQNYKYDLKLFNFQ